MLFSTNLDLSRTDDSVDSVLIPELWAQDHTVSYAARGLLIEIASTVTPETVVNSRALNPHRADPPMVELVAELVAAGYLHRAGADFYTGGDRYELVEPQRLPHGQ
jgi:hypothetical protein